MIDKVVDPADLFSWVEESRDIRCILVKSEVTRVFEIGTRVYHQVFSFREMV